MPLLVVAGVMNEADVVVSRSDSQIGLKTGGLRRSRVAQWAWRRRDAKGAAHGSSHVRVGVGARQDSWHSLFRPKLAPSTRLGIGSFVANLHRSSSTG